MEGIPLNLLPQKICDKCICYFRFKICTKFSCISHLTFILNFVKKFFYHNVYYDNATTFKKVVAWYNNLKLLDLINMFPWPLEENWVFLTNQFVITCNYSCIWLCMQLHSTHFWLIFFSFLNIWTTFTMVLFPKRPNYVTLVANVVKWLATL